MRTPWKLFKDVFAAFRGEDPQREMRFVIPYGVSGIFLSADESLSLATVWACIDIIAKNVAAQKWCIYEPIPGTKRRKVLDQDWKAWMLNTRPNPEMTAIGFREAMLFQAIPFGNAYAEIVRDAGGRVVQLWPLMSDRMRPRRDRETWELYYEYTNPDGSVQRYTQRQIFHVRGPGMWGLMGDNIVARAAKTIGVAAAQERFSASFFGQGAQPTGVLTYPGKLPKDVYDRLKSSWDEKQKGPENAHKPLILEAGMKFEAISIDPQKSQLSEDKKFSVEEICRWFGVPPHKVQHLEHATFSNIEHSSIEFVRDALKPWERRLCQEADAKLFDQNRGPWKYTEIDLRPLMAGDAQSRAQAAASWRQNGIKNTNEIRAEEGLDDIGPEGDVYIVQSNMATLDTIINPPEPPAPQLPSGAEPDGEDVDLEEGDAESTDEVAYAAVKAAVFTTMNRYSRRLANRRRDLRGTKEEQDQVLAAFRMQQRGIVLDELTPFNELFARACGFFPSTADATRLIELVERGADAVVVVHETFPKQLTP